MEKRHCKILFLVILLTFLPGVLISQSNDSLRVDYKYVGNSDFGDDLLLDLAIQDKIPGLIVTAKSAMPNEGAYLNFRGIHSFIANNTPLLVLNGVPYFGNEDISQIVNGYSRSVFSAINVNDIKSVKLLVGADAAMYGSLGSNAVILIETNQATSDNLDTRISFTGKYGVSMPKRTIPTLGVTDYKNYLQDIGTTRYGSLNNLVTDYPFLRNEDNYHSYLFNNNTDWISLIQSPALVSDNVFRVEGGDAIAKYNLSFGYTSDGGVIGQTRSERYNTLINTNIMVSRKVDIYANVGLSYINSDLQEQGISEQTNPLLAASLSMPLLSPFKKEPDGNILNRYAAYNEWNVNEHPVFSYDNVSNPLAIVNTVKASDKIYDANIRLGLNYHPNVYLTINGLLNIYMNYTEESIFIPGVTDHAIIPQYYGVGFNTVRRGVIQNRADYFGINASYDRTFEEIHAVKATAGVRYLERNVESDFASGYNTSNDYFRALTYVTEDRRIWGSNLEWKWLNYYLNTTYNYKNLIKANFNVSVDGSSVSGADAPGFGVFPALEIKGMLASLDFVPSFFSVLDLTAGISSTGNSRFSSNYAKNYYQNSNLFNLGTIVRTNVPNTKLEWEKNTQFELGLDASLFENLININVNYFNSNAHDLLVARNISSVYGSAEYYDNTGQINTRGIEMSMGLQLIHTSDIDLSISGSLAFAKSRIVTLGNSDELLISFKGYDNDDAMVIMRKGESPYQFYGYKTDGIYSTTEKATEQGLKNIYGNPYQAGDVIFVNENDADMIINAKDKVLLGSATPDYFGSINTSFRYKKYMLKADFGYSVGNMAYNAVRRELESMSNFHNQSQAVVSRWQVEGQRAALPRATYGDPAGNNLFSDRWIEDASFFKVRNLTLQYSFGKLLNLCQSGNVFVSADNILTLTRYLGSDPEFAYSYAAYMQGFDYAKVARPRTIQFGFQLFF